MQHINNNLKHFSYPDMQNSQQLLAIAIALVATIKHHIPYSTNINTIFAENSNNKMYQNFHETLENNTETVKQAGPANLAQKALELGAGNCAELSCCIMLLAAMLDAHSLALTAEKPVYISMLLIIVIQLSLPCVNLLSSQYWV